MSKLTREIKRLDHELHDEEINIKHAHEDFNHAPGVKPIMTGLLLSSLAAGIWFGRRLPLKFKTAVKIPFKIAKIATVTKFLLDRFHPQK